MNRPAVSIIIPTYNRARLLREALDSVAAQTFTDFEVIVVDDGSSEPIEPIIVSHRTRPRLIRQRNLGPGAARNRGLEQAAASLIAFLDSDDLWLPAKLETFVAFFQSHPEMQIAYGPMTPINAGRQGVSGRTKPCHDGWITEKLFCSSFVHVPAVVARKALIVRAGGFRETLPVCEDYDLWLRISAEHPFGLVEQPLALRRLHDGRLSKSKMSRNLSIKARMLREFFESGCAQGKLRPEIAATRLAKVHLAAARAAIRNGEFHAARDCLRASRRYGQSLVRVAPWLAVAAAMCRFERKECSQVAAQSASLSEAGVS